MTELRQFLRPVPLVLIAAFVAVALVDFIEWCWRAPLEIPDLLRDNSLMFEPAEPMIDLRRTQERAEMGFLPPVLLEDGPWQRRGTNKVWFSGKRATIEMTLTGGGQPVLAIQCRPAAGKKPVRALAVNTNDTDCGVLDLLPGWNWYHLPIPEGALRAGVNLVTFTTPDRRKYLGSLPAVHFRRLALQSGNRGKTHTPVEKRLEFEVDPEKGSLAIHRSGWLKIPFTIDGRIDALVIRYRFRKGGGRGEATIARPQGTGPGREAPVKLPLVSSPSKRGRIRFPLHGYRGNFVLTLGVELEGERGRLEIESLQLVNE